MKDTLGERVKKRRLELEITQADLAERMGYKSATTIAKLESGDNDLPQSKLVKFAQALHTTPEYIMGWTEDSFEPIPNMADRKNDIYFSMNQMREILLDDEVAALYKGEVLSNGKRQTILTVLDSIDGIAQIK